jgi:glycosyltransferase involved in cell wall biosynthesis
VSDVAAPRVVHVDTEHAWGGGQRQVHALAVGLQERGLRSWAAVRPRTDLAVALTRDGVSVLGIAPRWEWDPVAALRLRALLRRVGADVVHAHAAHAVATAALASHGTTTQLLVSRRVALPLRRNPLSRWKYGRSARFLAVSERVRTVLCAGGVAPQRVAVVRSGIDLRRPPRRAEPGTLRELGVEPGHRLVVMVSSLIPPHKDPDTFLAAIAAARGCGADVHALLVGGGPLEERARRTRRRLGLENVVTIPGFRRDAVELLAAADVAVLSSREEGLGTTLLDAMAAGVPVVATAAGGVAEIVRDGLDGLLTPVGDGAALGAAIARVLGDRALRNRLVAAGLQRVRQFTIERTVDETLAVYRALADPATPAWGVVGR